MRVECATIDDIPGWLSLAAEVESLFGPMVGDLDFHDFLQRNIGRGTALCVRELDRPPGGALMGGLAFSARRPLYRIGWLSVAARWRRAGVGRMLVESMLEQIQPPAEVLVTTFGEDIEAGRPARALYESLGFHAAEPAPIGPEGGSRQIFRRVFGSPDVKIGGV
jgi:GNAT superfamily N-acetyltransferase